MKISSRTRITILILLSLALVRCGIFFGSNKVDNKHHDYTIVELDKEKNSQWREIQKDESDHAYEHQTTGAIISINSVCGEDRGKPLEELLQNLFLGLKPVEETKPREIQIDGGRALEAVIEPEDTDTKIDVAVFKKSGCTFDFFYVSPKKTYAHEKPTFSRFLKGFHAKN